jgi:phosphoethanolamine N-methyltransferase
VVQFEACLKKELQTAEAGREDFLRDFSAADLDAIVSGWKEKLVRVGEGEQRWGLFLGTKPV